MSVGRTSTKKMQKNKASANSAKFVVGIGASAGGLEAIQDFFDHMQADTGAAFVVIQHLSPDFESFMGQLLKRNTKMKIHLAKNNMRLEKNSVYLMPPKKNVYLKDGCLKLVTQQREHFLNLPVDIFMESLAEEYGKHSIGIILSGTGSDGSRGIVTLAKAGGFTMVQDPNSAKFDGMPRNAIATKFIDMVLDVESMHKVIQSYIDDPDKEKLKKESEYTKSLSPPNMRIFALLMARYNLDFSLYKTTTISRRLDRRLQANSIHSLDGYADLLSRDEQELEILYNDLLIGVTCFFRDDEPFNILENKVVPNVVESHIKSGSEIRIWVPACSTGEEAYSIGIIFKEYLLKNKIDIGIKIFATDINKNFIDYASIALYTKEQVENVSPKRLEKFFIFTDGQYQVSPEVRNLVVFAQHNLINDPPFTRMDLVSCRNFLIYVQTNIQKKILGFLRFALNVKGYLFLGSSETIGNPGHDLDTIDSTWKLFQKNSHVNYPLSLSQTLFTNELLARNKYSNGGQELALNGSNPRASSMPLFAYDLLLARIIDDGLLIDDQLDILHIFGDGKKYITFESGRVSTDIMSVILPELKSPLTKALHRINLEKKDVTYLNILVNFQSQKKFVSMAAVPLLDKKNKVVFTLIKFKENIEKKTPEVVQNYSDEESNDSIIKELQFELKETKETLQTTIEEVKVTSEELQATNEEMLASNEELQSTNEELHSVNEELYTVNAEYQKKIEELTRINNDIDNFIRSTDIGTVFVDASLCIQRYTPAISEIFDLFPQDIGRSLETFTYKIKFDQLIPKVKAIIKSRDTFVQEVQTTNGNWFFMRIQPYLIKTGHCEGAVLSFIDIHDLKLAHHELMDKESRYRALIEATSTVVWEVNQDGEFCSDLISWCDFTGQKPFQVRKYGWIDAIQKGQREICRKLWLDSIKQQKTFHFETKVWSEAHKSYHYVRLEGAPHFDSIEQKTRWICTLTDIDVEKRFDEKFRFAVQASPYSALIIDKSGKISFVNTATLNLAGYTEQDLLGKPVEVLIPESSRDRHERFREVYMQNPTDRIMGNGIETFLLAKSGKEILVEVRLSPIQTDNGIQILCSMEDITRRVRAEEVLQRYTEELEVRVFQRTHELVEANEMLTESRKEYALLYEDAPDMYASVSLKDASIIQCNNTLVKNLGFNDKKEIIGKTVFDLYAKESLSLAKKIFKQFINEGTVDNVELSLLKKDGSIIPVMLNVSAVKDKKGNTLYRLSSWRDITVQKELEKERKTSLELDLIYRSTSIFNSENVMRVALQKTIDMICEVINWPVGHAYFIDDITGDMVSSKVWHLRNPRKLKRFKDQTESSVVKKDIGLPGRIWSSQKSVWVYDVAIDDNFARAKVCNDLNLHAAIGFPIIVKGEVVAICEFFAYESLTVNNDLLEIFQLVGEQVGSVLERKHVERRLESLAHYDVLTGLPNRAYFNTTLERYIERARGSDTNLALLYLDLDNFKNVNDTLGHSIGDKLLQKVADEMQNLIRGADFIGRIGGDEFVVIMDDIESFKESAELSRKILEKMAGPFYIDNHEILTSVSVGIAIFPDGGANAEMLLKNADMAMYSAKDNGKNRFTFYSSELNSVYQRQTTLEQHLHHAIKNNELHLVYQPQISLQTGQLHGFEALLRWQHSKLGNISPVEFIPIAEDVGLIRSIGDWVLDEALKQYKAWEKVFPKEFKEHPLMLAINASVVQLMQKNFASQVQAKIQKYKINPKYITLEVTETSLMLNLKRSIKALEELHAEGVIIAIDDFGTGYSSLSYLKQLPFNFLKIDRSFVQNVQSDKNDASIVNAIIQLGEVLDLKILAEGVETKAGLEFLKKAGCHYAQGFYFDKPLNPEQVIKLLQKKKPY